MSSTPEWNNQQDSELRAMLSPGQWLIFQCVPSPDGHGDAYALSIQDGEEPGCAIIAVTEEKLLAKLRSIKGQYVFRYQHWTVPIFYYEYCKMDPRQRIVPDQR
jgi:hypothetical protein